MKTNISRLILACAQAVHEANRAYCAYCEALGDVSQLPWEDTDQEIIESCLIGVRGVLVDKNTPKQSHESWMREKERNGWIYGPVKDSDCKEHPCMVAYSELPEEQRRKDEIFVTVVKTVAKALGWDGALG